MILSITTIISGLCSFTAGSELDLMIADPVDVVQVVRMVGLVTLTSVRF